MASGNGVKVVLTAVIGNLFITVIKFIGWFFSSSPSLLAEAIHSLADTFNQILLFIGMKQSNKKYSRDLPTGSGGARYLWNLISAVGIFFIGFGVTFYHGIHSLLQGHFEVGPISYVGIIVLTVSFIIEFYVLIGAYKEVKLQKGNRDYLTFIKESDDPTIVAVLLEDGVAVLGVVLALIGIIMGQVFQNSLFDIIVSLIISFLLALLAVLLGVMNSKLLIGKSLSVHKEEQINKFILNQPEIDKVLKLSTRVLGAGQVRLSLEVEIHGESIIDYKMLDLESQDIKNGANPAKVLVKSSERMVRITGNVVNELQKRIHSEFPELSIIDFEIT